MGMCEWFFWDATQIQNGRQRSTLKFFVGAKTVKLEFRNFSNFPITFPRYGDVQVTFSRFYWNSKWPPQINLTQKICLVNFFLNFNIIIYFPVQCTLCSLFLQSAVNQRAEMWISHRNPGLQMTTGRLLVMRVCWESLTWRMQKLIWSVSNPGNQKTRHVNFKPPVPIIFFF